MFIVHFSEDREFEPEPLEQVPGYVGVWFYKEPEDYDSFEKLWIGWGYRSPFFFEIEDRYVTLEQEFDGYNDEYFVDADHLDKLKPIDAPSFVSERLY